MGYDPNTPDVGKTGVYQITNLVNGKFYIGSAAGSFRRRWTVHLSDFRNGNNSRHLQAAWDKYGPDAFHFEILFVCDAADCLKSEQALMDYLRPWVRTIGYNLTPTAGSPLGIKHNTTVRAANGARAKQRLASPEARAAHSSRLKIAFGRREYREAHSARQKLAKGTPEYRAKASARAKKRYESQEARDALSIAAKTYWASEAVRAAHSERAKVFLRTPDFRAAASARTKKQFESAEARAANSARCKKRCESPQVRAALFAQVTKYFESAENRATHSMAIKRGQLRAKLRRASELLVILQG